MIPCRVNSDYPFRFFAVTFTAAIAFIFLYMVSSVYCIAWMLHPTVGKLERLLAGLIYLHSSYQIYVTLRIRALSNNLTVTFKSHNIR